MEPNNYLTLYQKESCPYCQLVRKKLSLLNLPYLSMPVEENGVDRKELLRVSGQNEVPVLVDGEEVVIGSSKIIEFLDAKFGNGESDHMPSGNYGYRVTATGSIEKIKSDVLEALKTQGFGVLTEIDVQATLKKKLDVDVPKQLILGACNPHFAHKAMEEETAVSLLLPCNVTIREIGPEQFEVSVISPLKLLTLVGREDLIPFAKEAKKKLYTAIDQVAS